MANNTTTINSPVDLLAISKTVVMEAAFVGSLLFIYFGHPDLATLQVAETVTITTGTTLGIWRISDILANIANVRAYLGAKNDAAGGYSPLPQATTLFKNGGPSNASPPTT